MSFANPFFLFGLLAVLVPVFIHLFNFRRYKIFYFSNVKMLREVIQKTRRESQLQHLIVLLLRIVGIVALVFAFARPYIPHAKGEQKQGNLVTIFVDNSFSMEANTKDANLLQDAILAARNIAEAFSYSDDFVLITQDFSAKQSHILNKEELLLMLDEIEISPNSHSLEEIIAFENSASLRSVKENVFHYYISDFQKCNFDMAQLSHEKQSRSYLIPAHAQSVDNVAVDSCWFLAPVFKVGQTVTLNARIKNYSQEEVVKLPVKLYVNEKQTAMATVDLKPGSATDVQLSYRIEQIGAQRAKLFIGDSPITYDDQLFFTYQVMPASKIVALYENAPNKFLRAMYGKDSLFVYKEMNVKQVDYSQLADCQLVVLDEISSVSSGLAEELKRFVTRGGTMLCFPNENIDLKSWQILLSALDCDYYFAETNVDSKVGKINYESRYFKGSLESTTDAVEKPKVLKYFEMTRKYPAEMIMQLENGSALLVAYTVQRGMVLLSAVPFADDFGEVHKHALSFIPFHNIGIMSQLQEQLCYTIGENSQYQLNQVSARSEDVFALRSKSNGEEIIPEQRSLGSAVMLYCGSQISQPGFYDIVQSEKSFATLAFNYNRKESDLACYKESELAKMVKNEEDNVEIINADEKNLTGQIAEQLNGTPLWRWFILLALSCFLAEVLLLRFWGRVKVENSTSTVA